MSYRNPEYNLGSSKPLINREQTYYLDRKLLTVHSEDRDITKWPNSNTFEIVLPETLTLVQSMRLIQATMPARFFVFSNDYQNTMFQFTIGGKSYIISPIQEGIYTPHQLSVELSNKMNEAIQTDASFNVFYDEVRSKFWFGHTDLSFNLDFDQQINYTEVSCEQPTVWNNYSKWGLPYYLGFHKKCYKSLNDASGVCFDYICPNSPSQNYCPDIVHYVEAPLSFTINGETCIYMEMEKYNNYDELYPYNESSRQMFDNNAYNGKVNSAFGKIPIRPIYNDTSFDSRTLYLLNMVQYDPPIERIVRLKFKFRFHDGRLVNFQNFAFDFTIEFNCLRNEIEKQYKIRIPAYII